MIAAQIENGTTPLGALVAGLGADPEWETAVARAMSDAIAAEVPELGEDPDLRAGTYASTLGVVRRFVEMVVSDADPASATSPPAADHMADELARRGISIDTLLRAYTVGHGAFFRRWGVAVHDALPDPVAASAAIEQALTWTFPYVDAMVRGITQRYAAERERWVRSAAAIHTATVRKLLEGEPLDVDNASRRLGYRLDRRHLAFVIWCRAGDDQVAADLATLERAAAEVATAVGAGRPLLVPFGPHLVAGWVGADKPFDTPRTDRLELGRRGLGAAFGSPGEGVLGFTRSHTEATHARRVAELIDPRAWTITHYSDVRLVALVSADMAHARAFVAGELGRLSGEEDEARRLADTLLVYLEEQRSLTRSAQRLGVHHNTIGNRIRAAQQLLEEPIDDRPAELLVALRLARLLTSRG
jgi:DNA-binding PucR family transcriptional regulator